MTIRERIAALFAKQRKANPVGTAIVAMGAGRPVWMDTDLPGLALQGYQRNPYVYRAVNLIAEGVSSLPWLAYIPRAGDDREELPDTHPALALLRKPNPDEWQAMFLRRVVSFLLLGGNSYIAKVQMGARVEELWALRPDRVQIMMGDATQPIRSYRYEASGRVVDLPAGQVLHLKTFHPMDDFIGMPVIEAAARSLDQNNEARAHNVALLQNGARPSAIARTMGELSTVQRKTLKEDLNEAHAGTTNAGKLLLLEAGMELQPWGLSPVDMDWLEGMRQSAREIVMTLGVPPEMVGDTANKTYNSYPEARRAFYQEAVLPWADFLRDALNHTIAPLMGAGLLYGYDRENIEALQEDAAARWKRALDAKRDGVITTNEARHMLGYDDDPTPEADKLLVSPTVMPLGDDPEPMADPFATSGPDAGLTDDEVGADADLPEAGAKAFNLRTPRAKAAHWKATDRARRRWIQSIKQQVAKRFRAERTAVRKAMGGAHTPDAALTAAVAELHRQRPAWLKLMRAIYEAVGRPFASSVLRALKAEARAFNTKRWDPRVRVFLKADDLKADDLEDVWLRAVQEWVSEHGAERVQGITETTERKIRNALQESIAAGQSIPDMQEKLDDLYLESIIPHRSEVIARTEVLSAANLASQEAARSTGLPLIREWIATKDDRTRNADDGDEYDHAEADGQKRAMDEPYEISGELLMFPGDSTLGASPGNTIMCRCSEGYHVADDDREE